MVFYVDDETDKEWSVAIHLQPRDLFYMGQVDEEEIFENEPYQQQEFEKKIDIDYEMSKSQQRSICLNTHSMLFSFGVKEKLFVYANHITLLLRFELFMCGWIWIQISYENLQPYNWMNQ